MHFYALGQHCPEYFKNKIKIHQNLNIHIPKQKNNDTKAKLHVLTSPTKIPTKPQQRTKANKQIHQTRNGDDGML